MRPVTANAINAAATAAVHTKEDAEGRTLCESETDATTLNEGCTRSWIGLLLRLPSSK